jgi:subtilisin family serine protease
MLAALVLAAPAHAAAEPRETAFVVLDAPPLARAIAESRALSPALRERLDLSSATSAAYLRELAARQRAVAERITRAIPGARVLRRYRVVVNGLAVSIPTRAAQRLEQIPGVAAVAPSVRYEAAADVRAIRAVELWGPAFETAGAGVKVAVLDDGVDPSHPFFGAAGLRPPAGFPKGNRRFTSGKVIVARSFAPHGARWRYARRPFDPQHSFHGTHVAGIVAGTHGVFPAASRNAISGVAPHAYIGNYKVLTIPTASGVGLDGNAPELVAAIEAAVRDGMDVINLSLGQPEVEPSRDVVAAALDAAALAGVVPVVAAGNDFADFGMGSVASPASAARAITVGAMSRRRVAAFSSAGPTALSYRMKPDVLAPGTHVLSSVPRSRGTWTEFEGTSMAAPHVAGGVALLRQRHPEWTVAQIKSAIVTTAVPLDGVPVTRTGGGAVDLVRADTPRLFAEPASVSFGLIRRGARVARAVELTDAGGGAGVWNVRVTSAGGNGPRVVAASTVAVPGRLELSVAVTPRARDGARSGYVVLQRSGITRRLPYWVGVTVPTLRETAARALARTGTYRGRVPRRRSSVTTYRYPERVAGRVQRLTGPEQVFAVRLRRPAANFGVAVLSAGPGVRVEPRVVAGGDESRLTGYAAFPYVMNPYLADFFEPRPVSGALRPAAGLYHVVFDTRRAAHAGPFTFRFWIDDIAPPRAQLATRSVPRGGRLRVNVSDGGSGVDPASVRVRIDGGRRRAAFANGRIEIALGRLARGRHALVLQVSDYQESRNNENVAKILPNTRRLATTFVVR